MRFLYTHIGYGYSTLQYREEEKIGDKGETILFVIMITSSLMFMYASLDIYFFSCGYQCFKTLANLFLLPFNKLPGRIITLFNFFFVLKSFQMQISEGGFFSCFKEKQLSQKKKIITINCYNATREIKREDVRATLHKHLTFFAAFIIYQNGFLPSV